MLCLNAVWRYAPPGSPIIVSDDASTDGTQKEVLAWIAASPDRQERVTLVSRHEHRGIAITKKALTDWLLCRFEIEDIILIEDDVEPVTAEWWLGFMDAARSTTQAHLLYLPTDWKYGRTLYETGVGPEKRDSIKWKQYCSGMVMYFRAPLLREVGSFDERFTDFGWEHNELTSRCLVAQGLNPEHYPHCVASENVLLAKDVQGMREKMAYHEVAHDEKERSEKTMRAHKNRPLYDRLIFEHRRKFAELKDPGHIRHRERFFSVAKYDSEVVR